MRYIIEGIKCSGKTTLSIKLKENYRKITIIEYRGSTLKNAEPVELHTKWRERLRLIASACKSLGDEYIILLRGHLFPFAINEGQIGKAMSISVFRSLDDLFKESMMSLVLLTVSKEAFMTRYIRRINECIIKNAKLLKWEEMKRIQEAYIKYYDISSMRKAIYDTTNTSVEQLIMQISREC